MCWVRFVSGHTPVCATVSVFLRVNRHGPSRHPAGALARTGPAPRHPAHALLRETGAGLPADGSIPGRSGMDDACRNPDPAAPVPAISSLPSSACRRRGSPPRERMRQEPPRTASRAGRRAGPRRRRFRQSRPGVHRTEVGRCRSAGDPGTGRASGRDRTTAPGPRSRAVWPGRCAARQPRRTANRSSSEPRMPLGRKMMNRTRAMP